MSQNIYFAHLTLGLQLKCFLFLKKLNQLGFRLLQFRAQLVGLFNLVLFLLLQLISQVFVLLQLMLELQQLCVFYLYHLVRLLYFLVSHLLHQLCKLCQLRLKILEADCLQAI